MQSFVFHHLGPCTICVSLQMPWPPWTASWSPFCRWQALLPFLRHISHTSFSPYKSESQKAAVAWFWHLIDYFASSQWGCHGASTPSPNSYWGDLQTVNGNTLDAFKLNYISHFLKIHQDCCVIRLGSMIIWYMAYVSNARPMGPIWPAVQLYLACKIILYSLYEVKRYEAPIKQISVDVYNPNFK